MRDRCRADEMIVCDLIDTVAPIGSELEQFGNTCGDRIVSALPDCRTRVAD